MTVPPVGMFTDTEMRMLLANTVESVIAAVLIAAVFSVVVLYMAARR